MGSFAQAIEQVRREYNSVLRQSRVTAYLKRLCMASIEAKVNNANSSLEHTYQEITRFPRRCPSRPMGTHTGPTLFRNAVVGNESATKPLSHFATHHLTIRQIYKELEPVFRLHKEARLAFLCHCGRRKAELGPADTPGILFEGQRKSEGRNVGLSCRHL